MGFLDNLENDLKNLESAAEHDSAERARQQKAREAEQASARAASPHAHELRNSAFTAELLNRASTIGRSRRLNVRVMWIGSTLRLQAGSRLLELRPTPSGVRAHFLHGNTELESAAVDFSSNPEILARRWLDSITAGS
ncbi:MAG TPA: hypothetical protein VFA54_00030 [Bryobacterales bacterium]|jgi:hypothetical protein|nr:hypothetical protein [Bryobacterales bacterium]